MEIKKINLKEKFNGFQEHWSPKIVGALNGQHVKLAKVKGEFVWHQHQDEDEMFFIVKGQLNIEFKTEAVTLNEGEMLIVPKGVEHRPVAADEVWLLLFEPESTKHTGETQSERTVTQQDWI